MNGAGGSRTDLQAMRRFDPKRLWALVFKESLQAMRDPKAVLNDLVRIGRKAVVSVPNFGHWKNRFYLMLNGRMPVTKTLSYQWYDTPNIHFCTMRDFVQLCRELGATIEQAHALLRCQVPAMPEDRFLAPDIARATALGVDGIISDFPDRL